MTQQMFLSLHIEPSENQDDEYIGMISRRLRKDMLELDVDSVDFPSGQSAPPESRGIDPQQVADLIVTAGASTGLLTAIYKIANSYVSLHKVRSIKLSIDGDELEAKGMTSREQRQALEAWMERHRDDER